MSRLAVKEYVKQQLADLDLPLPVVTFDQIPKTVQAGDQIVCVVKDPLERKSRDTRNGGTLGRPNAQKVALHDISLQLRWIAPDDQTSGTQFDVMLSKIDYFFEVAVSLPALITDPETGASSSIVYIGEDITTEMFDPMVVTNDEGDDIENAVIFAATKILRVQEVYTG